MAYQPNITLGVVKRIIERGYRVLSHQVLEVLCTILFCFFIFNILF